MGIELYFKCASGSLSIVLFYLGCTVHLKHSKGSYIRYFEPIWMSFAPIETFYSGFCLQPNCFLNTVGCSSWDIELAMNVLGEFTRGLVLSEATACITLI